MELDPLTYTKNLQRPKFRKSITGDNFDWSVLRIWAAFLILFSVIPHSPTLCDTWHVTYVTHVTHVTHVTWHMWHTQGGKKLHFWYGRASLMERASTVVHLMNISLTANSGSIFLPTVYCVLTNRDPKNWGHDQWSWYIVRKSKLQNCDIGHFLALPDALEVIVVTY